MTHVQTSSSSSPQKKILATCLVATVGVHLGAFFYFYQFPPALPYSWRDLIQSLPILRMVPKADESALLEEVFEPFPELSTLFVQPYDLAVPTIEERNGPLSEPVKPFDPIRAPELTATGDEPMPTLGPLATSFSFILGEKKFELALPETVAIPVPAVDYHLTDGIAALPPALEGEGTDANLYEPLTLTPHQVVLPSSKDRTAVSSLKTEAQTFSAKKESITTLPVPAEKLLQEKEIAFSRDIPIEKTVAAAEKYSLPKQKVIEVAAANLDADVRIMKATSGKGYFFAVALKPAKSAEMQKMTHNFTFLIDRSNSIEKYHFGAFKKAVLRALSMLKEEDTFNIIVFDKKAVAFSEEPVPFSRDALDDAEAFLAKQKNGGLFAAADLYEFLPKLIPDYETSDEVNTMILLTDGTTDASSKKQHAFITKFLAATKNRATLYTAAVARNNDLKLLDLVSSCTGGSLIYSQTYAAFSRKLAGLVYRLREPVAKDLSVSVIGQDPQSQVKLYTAISNTLYAGQPFEIVGKVDNLNDFTILIEGMQDGEPVQIKKKIVLENAKRDPAFVKKLWGAQKNQQKYKQYLDTGKASALKDKAPTTKKR